MEDQNRRPVRGHPRSGNSFCGGDCRILPEQGRGRILQEVFPGTVSVRPARLREVRCPALLHAVSFALLDSLNVLLIGVIVALGIMLPARGPYRKVATLLVAGDWFGVFILALLTMLLFDSLGDIVQRFIESPVFGWVLIAVGVLSLVLTLFSKGSGDMKLISRLLGPLREASWKTVAVGFVLGLAQSVTSGPFFLGLAVLSAGDFSVWIRYAGMVVYASLALSLPALSAVFIGMVRAYPYSPMGRAFEAMRHRRELMVKLAGYIVAVVLILIGVAGLL